jgi:glycolate oxidase FAD binding subunit
MGAATQAHAPAPDATLEALKAQVRSAADAGRSLRIRGGGSKDFLAPAAEKDAAALELSGWRGVVAYDPEELVLTVRGGTPLAEVEDLLAGRGQLLAFEPPAYAAGATIGGAVASGLAGPRRLAGGPVRDSVLGARLLDGRARELNFGGRVMKNVAGYDLARLMAGACGTLGVLLELSLKVLPRPAAELTLAFEVGEAAALQRVNAWLAQPWPVTASSWSAGRLRLRFSGSHAALARAARELGGEALDPAGADAHWAALRDQSGADFDWRPRAATLWRMALPASAPPLLPGTVQLHEWGGTQRWLVSTETDAVREAAARAGGHAVAFRNAPAGVPVFTPPRGESLAIQQRLRAIFDPVRVFNRSRFWDED